MSFTWDWIYHSLYIYEVFDYFDCMYSTSDALLLYRKDEEGKICEAHTIFRSCSSTYRLISQYKNFAEMNTFKNCSSLCIFLMNRCRHLNKE